MQSFSVPKLKQSLTPRNGSKEDLKPYCTLLPDSLCLTIQWSASVIAKWISIEGGGLWVIDGERQGHVFGANLNLRDDDVMKWLYVLIIDGGLLQPRTSVARSIHHVWPPHKLTLFVNTLPTLVSSPPATSKQPILTVIRGVPTNRTEEACKETESSKSQLT